MNLTEHQWLFLQDVAKLIVQLPKLKLWATGGELHRTPEQQLLYFQQGKSRVKTGGNHGLRLAIDLNVFVAATGKLATLKEISPAGTFWESLGPLNRWGR